jgi:hypothetical protein
MRDGVTIGGNVTGGNNQFGGSGSTFSQVIGAREDGDAAPPRSRGVPAHALHVFADIVGYSQLPVRLQKVSQDYMATVLDDSMEEAGVLPELVAGQDQGDGSLLALPPDIDVAKVLAVMPRYLNDELLARNEDMAPHARMRLRVAFSMGVSAPGRQGLVGGAPIAVARLVNWGPFRHAMTAATQAQCGVIIDDHLHAQYVRQQFRPDASPGEYVPARVRLPDKGFDATAWVRLYGYSGDQVSTLLASGAFPE